MYSGIPLFFRDVLIACGESIGKTRQELLYLFDPSGYDTIPIFPVYRDMVSGNHLLKIADKLAEKLPFSSDFWKKVYGLELFTLKDVDRNTERRLEQVHIHVDLNKLQSFLGQFKNDTDCYQKLKKMEVTSDDIGLSLPDVQEDTLMNLIPIGWGFGSTLHTTLNGVSYAFIWEVNQRHDWWTIYDLFTNKGANITYPRDYLLLSKLCLRMARAISESEFSVSRIPLIASKIESDNGLNVTFNPILLEILNKKIGEYTLC